MKLSLPLRIGAPAGLDTRALSLGQRSLLENVRFVYQMHDLMALFLNTAFVQYWPLDPRTGKRLRGRGSTTEHLEAIVNHTLGGPVVNFPERAMRARDPAATKVTDAWKVSAQARLGRDFKTLDRQTIRWLLTQKPIAVPLRAFSGTSLECCGVAIMPENCAFFGYMLGILQQLLSEADCSEGPAVNFMMLIAPPFRHSHFGGKQAVVHNIGDGVPQMSAYCLYPGPSGKKGIYALGLELAEKLEKTILHSSVVRLRTTSGSHVTLLHEGASGGGKSENILRPFHRPADGRILLSRHVNNGTENWAEIPDVCQQGMVHPVADDMAVAEVTDGRLIVFDAECGWFLRTDNSTGPGTDPFCEHLARKPIAHRVWLTVEPGLFPHPWRRTPDPDGVRNKNGRMTIGRQHVTNCVRHPVSVDIRSIGVRTPHCDNAHPYGVIGFCHSLPWWLAYLWRLAPPRGHDNPSIDASGKKGRKRFCLDFEGIGAYEAFLLGDPVVHANLLLEQFARTASIVNILVPNQHIGAYYVGFSPQNVLRAFLCSGGQIVPGDWAPCPLLGREVLPFQLPSMRIPEQLFRPHLQPELKHGGRYRKGAEIFTSSFREYLPRYLKPQLHPVAAMLIRAVVEGKDLRKLEVSPADALK